MNVFGILILHIERGYQPSSRKVLTHKQGGVDEELSLTALLTKELS